MTDEVIDNRRFRHEEALRLVVLQFTMLKEKVLEPFVPGWGCVEITKLEAKVL